MRRSTTLEHVVTYAGIDYHKKFSVVTLGDQNGKVIETQRLWNDRQTIRSFFAEFPGLICVVESCRGYEWFVDSLKELGLTVHVANPYKVKLIAESRCKTDKIDSRILMELLAIGFLPTCYQPTPEERELREQLRWRAHLVRNATRIKVRIHSLLDKENLGTVGPALFSARGRQHLESVKLSTPARQALLEEHMQLLEKFELAVKAKDGWVRAAAKENPDAQLLMTIPGIAELSALVFLAEVGNIARFRRSAQVVNFTGLCPSLYSSADTRRPGPITKQGSTLLRWVLIQDAWQAIRHSPALRFHFARVSRRCGRHGAIVAVARKLAEIAYHVLRTKQPYNELLLGNQNSTVLSRTV